MRRDLDIAARLTAITGADARRTTTDAGEVRLEVDLPAALSDIQRSQLLLTLGTADRYGHEHQGDRQSVWAELSQGGTT